MTKRDPFLIEGPANVSFSGGLTSAYMLWRILQAHQGQLPDDVHVCFANTGRERPETLDFVQACANHWDVRVRWLEWRPYPAKAPIPERFAETDHESADRDGRAFAALIAKKQYLPNPVTRFCTTELKIRVMKHFMLARGYDRWINVVGLRADEMMRVFRAIERNGQARERWRTAMPLADAKIRLADVRAFWDRQNFRLQLRPHEGNCDLCFLKGRDKRAAIIRDHPQLARWWIDQEKRCGSSFRQDETFGQLAQAVATSPRLPLDDDGDEWDAECGLTCGGDA